MIPELLYHYVIALFLLVTLSCSDVSGFMCSNSVSDSLTLSGFGLGYARMLYKHDITTISA